METFRIALAGNPNTGKSTLFNTLTGLKQHTGNWPGKTVEMAEGSFEIHDQRYLMIDLPGTYSLYSNSTDEEVARDYILFEKPNMTIVVVDASSLERNLNLALQVMEMTDQVILCVNLIDEAKRKGIEIDQVKFEKMLGIPVVMISARNKVGIDSLLLTIEKMAKHELKTSPLHIQYSDEMEEKIRKLEPMIKEIVGEKFPARWIALRLLDGDDAFIQVLEKRLDHSLQGGMMNESISISS